MLLASLALAAAVASASPDVIQLDDGCRLVRRAVVAKKRTPRKHPPVAAAAASAPASGVLVSKVRRRPLFRADIPAGWDRLCDEGEPPPPLFGLPLAPLGEPPPDAPVIGEPPAAPPAIAAPPLDLYIVPMTTPPETFEEAGGGPPVLIPIVLEGPVGRAPPPRVDVPLPAVAEPGVWAMLLAGVLAVARRARCHRRRA